MCAGSLRRPTLQIRDIHTSRLEHIQSLEESLDESDSSNGNTLILAAATQELLHGLRRLLVTTCQTLGGDRGAIVHDRDDASRLLVLHQHVNEFSRRHVGADLRKAKGIRELSLEVESHARAVGVVIGRLVLRVLDEVATSLPMATVILAVHFELLAVLSLDLRVVADGFDGAVEDGVGRHLGGQEFAHDIERARAGETQRYRPDSQTRGGDDLLAWRHHDLLRFLPLVFGLAVLLLRRLLLILLALAAECAQVVAAKACAAGGRDAKQGAAGGSGSDHDASRIQHHPLGLL
mmetsp:Transcript_13584/g.37417  ORF Transcript_13584/g.37417 Transcript_13584/m.37417 type:complete len:292 (+) Transcript_13584:142-1017(+)